MEDEKEILGGTNEAAPEYGTNAAPMTLKEAEAAEAGAAPPSYDSLYGRLKQANAEADNPLDYAKKSVSAVQGACGCCIAFLAVVLCCGLGLALPIAQIVIGALHLHDCPINYLIPIYLIVGGVFSLLAGGGSCGGNGKEWKNRLQRQESVEEGEDKKKTASNCCGSLISVFLLVWLCCGTVWTVRARPFYTPIKFTNATVVDPLYCDETVFQFAFWLSMAAWIFAGAVLVGLCFACCCLCVIRCCTK